MSIRPTASTEPPICPKRVDGGTLKEKWAYGLLIGLAAFVVAFAPFPTTTTSQPGVRTVRIEAGQFSYSPSEIAVHPGDTVTIELVSTDVVHGLYIDGYGVSTAADPGQTSTLTFVANRAGSFRIRCNVTCGAMHPFMLGILKVGQDDWLYRSFGLAAIALATFFAFEKPPEAESPHR